MVGSVEIRICLYGREIEIKRAVPYLTGNGSDDLLAVLSLAHKDAEAWLKSQKDSEL